MSLMMLWTLALFFVNVTFSVSGSIVLGRRNLNLSLEAAYLSSSLYSDYYDRCLASNGCPQEWTVVSQYKDSNDAAVLTRSVVSGQNYCMAAFRGTTVSMEDWMQNLNPFYTKVCSSPEEGRCCNARAGYVDGYYADYYKQFEEDIHQCMIDCPDCQLVLTGPSQGGAIASVAAVVFEQYTPTLITFGQPATFDGRCPPINVHKYYRFVDTIVDSGGDLEYDPIPFLEVERADQMGNLLLMGDDIDNVVLFPDGSSPGYEVWDADTDAHDWLGYVERLASYLDRGSLPLGTDGWAEGSFCNWNSECASPGTCFSGVCQYGETGAGCYYNEDCFSMRCEGYSAWVTGGECHPRLDRGSWCDENSDCISNSCRPTWSGIKCR